MDAIDFLNDSLEMMGKPAVRDCSVLLSLPFGRELWRKKNVRLYKDSKLPWQHICSTMKFRLDRIGITSGPRRILAILKGLRDLGMKRLLLLVESQCEAPNTRIRLLPQMFTEHVYQRRDGPENECFYTIDLSFYLEH